jgi:hypothetical protein
MPSVKIEQGHLVFESRISYDRLFELSAQERKNLLNEFESKSEFTSYREKKFSSINANQRIINGCNVPDSLIEDNDDLFRTLDNDGVVQIGSDLYRYDYCNDKVFVIAYAIAYQGNNYNDFLAGNTSNSNVGWFPTYVDVLDAVAEGYRTMPDPKSVENNDTFRQGADGGRLHEWKYFYDMEDDGSTPSNTRMDGVLAYDKFGIYFHLYGKEKYQRHGWLGWQTAHSGGTRNWLVNYQYTYLRKGHSSSVSGSATLTPSTAYYDPNKVEATIYSGGKKLMSYFARWDVRNYTTYHSVRRKSSQSAYDVHIGTYQTFPTNTPMNVYNYSYNIIINFGSPSYYQIIG